MSLGRTLTTYAELERRAEELLTQDNLCNTLRQERDECKALITLFREQQIPKSRLWVFAGGSFQRMAKPDAFKQAMKTLEEVLAQLKKAEATRTTIAQQLLKDPGLSVICSDPQVHNVLAKFLENE